MGGGRVDVTRLPISEQVGAIGWKQHLILYTGNRSLLGSDTRRMRGQCPYFSLPCQKETIITKILTYFSKYNGSPVVIGDCSGPDTTWFGLDDTLFAYDGSMCLDVTDGVDANGVKLQLWECAGSRGANLNQSWDWKWPDYHMIWTNHTRCVDLPDGNTETGNQAQMWDCVACVKAFNVCLITDSRNLGITQINARFRSLLLYCERLTLGALLVWDGLQVPPPG